MFSMRLLKNRNSMYFIDLGLLKGERNGAALMIFLYIFFGGEGFLPVILNIYYLFMSYVSF